MPNYIRYIRKSRADDPADAKNSVARQNAVIDEWEACNPGYTCVGTYQDTEGWNSGGDVNRPEWQRLLAKLKDLRAGDALVAESNDRFNRDTLQSLLTAIECRKRGIRFIMAATNFEVPNPVEDPGGWMSFTVRAAGSEFVRNDSARKIRETLRIQRQKHHRYLGKPPFGTTRNEDGHLVPVDAGVWWHPETGETIEADTDDPETRPGEEWQWRGYHAGLVRVFEVYAGGEHGFLATAEKVSDEGYRYCGHYDPRDWKYSDVKRCLLAWRTYAGHLVKGRPTSTSVDDRGFDIVARDVWEPIVPKRVLLQAWQVYKTRTFVQNDRRTRDEWRVYELSSVLYCHDCGRQLRGITHTERDNGNVYRYERYQHRRKGDCQAERFSRPADEVDEAVLAYLSERFRFEDIAGDVAEEADRLLEPYDEQDDTALQRAELEEERQRLIKAYRREIISLDDLEREIADIDYELRELEAAEKEKPPSIVLPPTLFQAIKDREPEDRRRLYQMLLKRIDYDLDEHSVTSFEPQPWAKYYFG